MIIHSPIPKSKKKLKPKAVREQYAAWLKSHEPKKLVPITVKKTVPSPRVPPGRETPKINSLDTGFIPCTKSVTGDSYTGTKMLGIGTLHKSNAVPVFNNDEAVDMAKMRR